MLYVLYFGFCLLASVALGESCDLKRLESLSGTLKYDATSLNQYQKIIAQLDRCTTDQDGEDIQKGVLLRRLYYRSGIIQLSLNQGLNAIESFEHAVDGDDSFSDLARSRLRKLYVEFGMWDRIDSSDDTRRAFMDLERSARSRWAASHDHSLIDGDLHKLLEISPSCLKTRSLLLETLFHRLAGSLDVLIGHEIIRNYERLLETHGSRFTLDKRLHIYHSLAIIQAFILNTEPTHLRKCLALDMDYEPCRRLALLNNKLSKINPSRSEVLDPDVYGFGNNAFDWHKLVSFYLKDQTPWIRVARRYKNNYELILAEVANAIEQLLPRGIVTGRPNATDFTKFIDMALCQAASESATDRVSAQPFCKLAMKEILPKETIEQLHKSAKKDGLDLERILTETWQSYPHLAIYMIQFILDSRKGVSSVVEDKLYHFFQHQGLSKSSKRLIQSLYHKLSSMIRIRRQKQQQRQGQHQRQRQQQQQQWFYNQQQQHQRQEHTVPPNGPRTDRDYYKILGIPESASSKQIRKAYLDFTKKYHPDKQGQLSEEEENKVHEKMSQINEAYETLYDDQKRREYDQARSTFRSGSTNQHMFRQGSPRGGTSKFGSNFAMNFKPNFKFNFG
ncbi:hypothetical protein HG536_0F01780 [Torulaspora globosa]|uniref:J domain-containing protein n=1 Tax=Torulaspora globosa TaxID=48254 RepID=A0A7G3ZK17_9SACH|nr:uncharacterized protein HG536_0F01780 [Torulaspora globosa]QLL33853.1 hypothetical protein HG536_0F01780 [Torulaspora globosa]